LTGGYSVNIFSYQKRFLILGAGGFFSLAPLWAVHIQQVFGHTLFGTPDPIVMLGITLLVSLLASYLLPDFSNWTTASSSCRIRTKALGFGVGLLTLVFLVWILYLVNQHILHSFLSSADEHSCYFLAECLRKGKLFVDIPAHADFFKVVHVGMRDGKWFSVYPLGWPLIWALGLNLNIVDWLNPAMSALAIFFFYLAGIRLFSRKAVVLGLVLCVFNPFFMFTAASYFSHATCLLCISVFLYAFLRWRESYLEGKDPVGWAAVCAVAVGYGLMTRYLTMAAIAGPFLLYHYLPIFLEWKGWKPAPAQEGRGGWFSWLRFLPFAFKRPQLRKSDWIAVGIVALFMISILYQNYLVTGKAFRPPNKHDKSWERLGFRRDYTPVDAFFYLIARVFYLMDWFAPAIVGAYLFVVLRLRRSNAVIPECPAAAGWGSAGAEGAGVSGFPLYNCGNDTKMVRNLFRLGMVFIAFAYFFYYSWGGNQWGPRYLWEGMPFLCIAVMDWICSLWRDRSAQTRKFLLAFLVTSLVTSGVILVRQSEYVEESSRQRKALYALVEQTITKPSIVFIHGFLGSRLVFAEEDAIRNSPFLDTKILYAHDLGDRNQELMSAYPGREFYRGTFDGTLNKPKLEPFLSK